MFIPRMWFDEVERIGKRRCTPFGSMLQSLGELIGLLGLLALLTTPIYLIYRVASASFEWRLLWLLIGPFILGGFGSLIVRLSWRLATRKQFKYDYELRESSWLEGGELRTYTYKDWASETGQLPR